MVHPYKYTSAAEALTVIQSNQRIFIQGSASTPLHLVRELTKQHERLQNVEVVAK